MTPRVLPAVLALLPFLGTTSAGQVPASFDGAWADVAVAFREQVAEQGVVGASLAFVRGDRILAMEVAGDADRATGRAVDERTIYHWASITKTFTAIALMQLRDRGLVSLDDPITDYVPELRAAHNPYGSMDSITIRQVMSHSAGFRNSTWPWGGSEPWHPHEPTEWSQLVAMMPYTGIEFEPGSRYSYSNPGIIFIGRVIEVVSGEPYETYVEKNILRPLDMRSAYFDTTPYHLLPFRSNNYFADGSGTVANGLDFDTGITVSNGGLNASVPDMARYLAFLVGSSDVEVLSRTSLDELWHEQVRVGEEDGLDVRMGLSFFLLSDGERTFVGHTGGQKGFVSFFYVHPPTRTGVIGVFNTLGTGSPPRPDTRGILSDVRGRLFRTVFPLF